jgi:hypothetical protein
MLQRSLSAQHHASQPDKPAGQPWAHGAVGQLVQRPAPGSRQHQVLCKAVAVEQVQVLADVAADISPAALVIPGVSAVLAG